MDEAKEKPDIRALGREVREAWREWLADDSRQFPPTRFLNAVSDLMEATDPDAGGMVSP